MTKSTNDISTTSHLNCRKAAGGMCNTDKAIWNNCCRKPCCKKCYACNQPIPPHQTEVIDYHQPPDEKRNTSQTLSLFVSATTWTQTLASELQNCQNVIKTNRNIRFFDTMSMLPISSFASQLKLSGSKQIPRSWRESKTGQSSSLPPLTLLLLVKKKLVHRLWFFLLSWTNGTDQKPISSSSNAIASSKENEKTMKRAKQQETTWCTSKKHKNCDSETSTGFDYRSEPSPSFIIQKDKTPNGT